MILTTCAACAAPLAHDAPRCVRCKIRYCDSTCQHDHWRRGHKLRDPGATLNDLHEAVTTLEEIERNAWRLLGGAHPLRLAIEDDLKAARLAAALRAREIS